MVRVTCSPVNFFGGVVLADDLEVNRSNLVCPRLLLHEVERLSSPPSPTMRVAQIKLVDKGVPPQIFEAVSKGQDDIADCHFLLTYQPCAAEGRFPQELKQSDSGTMFVEGVAIVDVVLAHHRQQEIGVSIGGETERRFHVQVRQRSRSPTPSPSHR